MSEVRSEIDLLVGGRLKTRRLLLGLSQTAVAEALGVTFQQLHRYERGINRISASALYKLTQILNVDPAYFFQKASMSNQPANDLALRSDADCQALNAAFLRIAEPDKRRQIVSMVQWISVIEGREKQK